MSSEWLITTLEEICKFTAGSAFKTEHQGATTGEHPFIKVSDMNLPGNELFICHAQNFVTREQRSAMKAKLHPAGATVFAKIGVALQSNRRRLLIRPTIIDNNMMSATPLEGNTTSRFLYFLLSTLDFNSISVGSALPYLNVSDLKKMEVSIPTDIATQKEIERILGALDDRITLLRETNATLEAIAQALFKSWFVDFDPVRAKMEGRIPEGMDEATAALFPDGFEESELGLVPKGWQVGSLLDAASLLSGGTPKTDRPEYWGGCIQWASAKDVSQSQDSVLIGTERTITKLGVQKSATRIIPAFSTVVVARGATTGRMVMLGEDMAMNQTCYALASKHGTPIAFNLQVRKEIGNLLNAAHGSVFDTITTATFAQYRCVLMSTELTVCFEKIVRPLIDQVVTGVRTTQTLATLLPRLISGQLRLPEAEALLEEACA